MILLQSVDKFDEVAVLDVTVGQLTWYSKQTVPDLASEPIRGHIAQLDGHTVILYREAEILRFRIDNDEFELTDNTRIELVRDDPHILTVYRNGEIAIKFAYTPPIIHPSLEVDPTPFVEEEDFDFGLFVHNVVNDVDRRNRIYR